jgi:predicted cation transporter
LVEEALVEPIKISIAVLAAGLLFKFLRPAARRAVMGAMSKIGTRAFAFIVVALLGLVSSVMMAIVAVIACFAIGIGAVLTPIGEPLSTIVVAKLKGEPYNASFRFLMVEFYRYILPGIFGLGILAAIVVRKGITGGSFSEDRAECLFPATYPISSRPESCGSRARSG